MSTWLMGERMHRRKMYRRDRREIHKTDWRYALAGGNQPTRECDRTKP